MKTPTRTLVCVCLAVACERGGKRVPDPIADEVPVADPTVRSPPGLDASPLPAGVWLRFQQLSVMPCVFAVRIFVADDGTVHAVFQRGYDCYTAIAPTYLPVTTLDAAALAALRDEVAHIAWPTLARAYRSSEHVNDGGFERYEVRLGDRVYQVDVMQIEHPTLAPLGVRLQRLMPPRPLVTPRNDE